MMESAKYRVRISTYDRELILKYAMLPSGLIETIKKKRSRLGEVSLELTHKELNEIAGEVAREANHTRNRQLAEDLNALCDHLEGMEDQIRRGW
jgi:hypothetical protein